MKTELKDNSMSRKSDIEKADQLVAKCNSISPNESKCTKHKGHEGDHHDYDGNFECFETWIEHPIILVNHPKKGTIIEKEHSISHIWRQLAEASIEQNIKTLKESFSAEENEHRSKKGCPYENGDVEGIAQMEFEIKEWKSKNRTQYDSMVTYLRENRRLIREPYKQVTHKDDNLVHTYDLKKGCSGTIIELTILEYELGTYIGFSDVEYPDTDVILLERACGFRIKAADASGREVDGSTKVEIQFYDPATKMFSSSIGPPYYTTYKEVSETPFKFEKHGLLEKFKQQRWRLITPDVDVVWKNVEYYGTWDLWRSISTVGTTGFQACLSNLSREAMKQEAPRPFRGE